MKNLMKGMIIFLTVSMIACSGLQLDTQGYVLKKDGSKVHIKGHTYFYSDTVMVCNKNKNHEIQMSDVKEIKMKYGDNRIK